MDLNLHQHPAPLYSLEEAAALLDLPAANLLLWEMHYGDVLKLPRGPFGEPLFSSEHLRIMREIERMIRRENRSPIEVRKELRQAGRNGPANEAVETRAIDSSHLEAMDEGASFPADETLPSESSLRTLTKSIANLQEDVSYLLEENRALQELVGRLITYIEEMGATQRERGAEPGAGAEGEAPSPIEEESQSILPEQETTGDSGRSEAQQSVRTWVPRALEE